MATLKIHNFGPVHDAIIEIRRFNLLIGEQSAGKSTIAKLIAIFTDYLTLAIICDQSENKLMDILESYDLNQYARRNDYSIVFADAFDGLSVDIQITPEGIKSQVVINGNASNDPEQILLALIQRKKFFNVERLLQIQTQMTQENRVKFVVDNVRNSMYIPAERIIASLTNRLLSALMLIKEQVPNNLLQFITELNNAKTRYSDFEIGLLNIKYKFDNGIEFVEMENEELLPLQNASSGMQSVIPLLLALKYAKDNRQYESYVVEEPECNLFPSKQIELLEILLSELYSTGRSLTITTHSPYLLSAMNNYLNAYKLSRDLKPEDKEELKELISDKLWIDTNDCSIYSLGEDINGGEYCKEIKDTETGLIDYNYLDGVSLEMSDIFSKIQRLYIRSLRKSRKNIDIC